jgi:hypothetical protein
MRSASGQGTVEYLAVVLLVALVFGGTATAATGAGRDIATAVPREVIRALCIVRGGDCYRDRAPCDVASTANSTSWAVTIAVIKVGRDKTVTVTRRSDRTYAVTLETVPRAGVESTAGARFKVNRGRSSFGAGADVTASVTGAYAHARTWVVSSRGAADQIIAAIKDGAPLPPEDIEERQGRLEGDATAFLTGTRGVANGSVGGSGVLGFGWQTDHKTGNRTYLFAPAISAHADASVKAVKVKASAAAGANDRFALTIGPDGRWLDLANTATGALSGRADLPEQVLAVAGDLDVPTAAGRQWVTESHFDLTDAHNLAATRAFVAAALDPLHPTRLSVAFAELSRRMRDNAIVDARTYAVDTETHGVEGHAGVEVKLGGKYENSTQTMRLVAATTRGINGKWRVRDECLQEART